MSAATIVLTLAGPLQAWGTSKGTENRRTELYPSKSGVLGIVASAIGRERGESFADLNVLEMTVRVDYVGGALTELHTARGTVASNKFQTLPKPNKDTILTYRSYRMDAVFTVFLTGERDLIKTVHEAMRHPVYAPFLGRRAAVPSVPVYPYNSVILDGCPSEYVEQIPWQAPAHVRKGTRETSVELVVVRDARPGDTVHGTVMDTVSGVREYLPRPVIRKTVTLPVVRPWEDRHHAVLSGESPFLATKPHALCPAPSSHDPFALLATKKD